MELVEGETLQERIAGRPMPINEALPIAEQIAEALESAHERGIVHRDLKPANIKVTAEGKVTPCMARGRHFFNRSCIAGLVDLLSVQ